MTVQEFLERELKKEEELTMEEVRNDPDVQGLQAPPELDEKVLGYE